MLNDFNPYLRWFDIPLDAQPPNHYSLLGLDLYESDAAAIEQATEQRLIFLQDVANGPYTKESQRLLNEVAAARLCLTDVSKKAAYDQLLRHRLTNPQEPVPSPVTQRPVVAERVSPLQIPQQQPAATDSSVGNRVGLNFHIQEKSASPSIKQKNPPRQTQAKKDAVKNGQAKKSTFANPIFVRNLLVGGAAASVLITVIAIAIFVGRSGKPGTARKNSDLNGASVGRLDDDGTSKPASANLASTKSQSGNSFAQKKFSGVSRGSQANNKSTAAVSQNDITRDGLVAWLDADDNTTLELNQGRVKTWKDKSQHQHDAVQESSENQPQLKADAAGGKPAVILDKPAYLSLKSTQDLSLGDNYTIAMVAWSDKGDLLCKGLPHKQDSSSAFSLFNGASRFRTSKSKYFEAKDDDTTKWKVRIAVADQKSFCWYIDGHNEFNSDAPHSISNSDPLVIGRRLDDRPEYAHGALAELLIYNRAISDAERKQLEIYLTHKWLK